MSDIDKRLSGLSWGDGFIIKYLVTPEEGPARNVIIGKSKNFSKPLISSEKRRVVNIYSKIAGYLIGILALATGIGIIRIILPNAGTISLIVTHILNTLLAGWCGYSGDRLISGLAESSRLWKWHGAEHKLLKILRKKRLVTIDRLKKASRVSFYCGTVRGNFLIYYMGFITYGIMITIVKSVPEIGSVYMPKNWDILRFIVPFFWSVAASYFLSWVVGMLMQWLVFTREPDEDQLQETKRVGMIAINSIKKLQTE